MADYLDLDELAWLLGLDRTAVYLLVRTTEIPAINLGHGEWPVLRADALEYKRSS